MIRTFVVGAVWLIVSHRAVHPQEPDTTAAAAFIKSAESLLKEGFTDSASTLLEKAALVYERYARWNGAIDAFTRAGSAFRKASRYAEALDRFYQALRVAEHLGPETETALASACFNVATVYRLTAVFDSALYYDHRALNLRKKLLGENHIELAKSYNAIGFIHKSLGDLDGALEFYEKALALRWANLGDDHPDVAMILNNIGIIYLIRGDYDLAEDFLLRALSIKLKSGKGGTETAADTYNNLSSVYLYQQRWPEALAACEKALDIKRTALGEHHANTGESYYNTGLVYEALSNPEQALDRFNTALAILEAAYDGLHPDLGVIHTAVGKMLTDLGRLHEAHSSLERGLSIKLRTLGAHHPLVSESYRELARYALRGGHLDSAMVFCNQSIVSLAPADASGSLFPTLDRVLSMPMLLESLELRCDILLARHDGGGGDTTALQEVVATVDYAGRLLQRTRTVYWGESSRMLAGDRAHSIHERGLNALFRLYAQSGDSLYLQRIFNLMENSRAGVLAQSLAETRARVSSGLPNSVVAVEASLRRELISLETELLRQIRRKAGDTTRYPDISGTAFRIHETYRQFLSDMERRYPAYYAMKYRSDTPRLDEIRRALRPDEGMIEFFIGGARGWSMLITAAGVRVAYVEVDSGFLAAVEGLRRSIRKVEFDTYPAAASDLFHALLGPHESELGRLHRLVLIPDGPVHHVPFDALLCRPAHGTGFTHLEYAIRRWAFVYHYSAALWLESRRTAARTAERSFVGFAPVFSDSLSGGQARLAGVLKMDSTADALRDVSVDGEIFGSLPYSETELNGIAGLFRKHNHHVETYVHGDATADRFKTAAVRGRYVHVATHGLTHPETPALSALLFTGRDSLDDGIVYASEIYHIPVEAELVVLSSCESGIGKIVRGEGNLAIGRGFLYAGARNVVYSLWKVHDRPTARMMTVMYGYLLKGEGPADALRRAKLEMIEQEATAFPRSWGAFVTVGP